MSVRTFDEYGEFFWFPDELCDRAGKAGGAYGIATALVMCYLACKEAWARGEDLREGRPSVWEFSVSQTELCQLCGFTSLTTGRKYIQKLLDAGILTIVKKAVPQRREPARYQLNFNLENATA